MVFAIAALFFQITPAVQPLDVSAVLPVAAAVTAASTAGQPKLVAATSGEKTPGSSSINASAPQPFLQASQALATYRIFDSQPVKQYRVIGVENMPSRRNWLILSFVQHGAATFDAYSTRQAIESGAREGDPPMRPFASSPAIYAAIQAGPAVLDLVARRMQRSQHAFIRRSWWLPQSAGTGLFIFSGAHNLSLANHP